MAITIDNLDYKIESAIENEIRYEKHQITNAGWTFLETIAPLEVKRKLKENFLIDGEIPSMTDIEHTLQDVIEEYENNNPPIRSYDGY